MQRYVLSKWKKTQALLTNDTVRKYIPETRQLNQKSLEEMLAEYRMVYLKPDIGSFGNGVMRVEADDSGGYKYQSGIVTRAFRTSDELVADLEKVIRGRTYLVQKGIDLLKYKGRRFDVRVMVQKNLVKRWETTGMIGRVAHPSKIVTNFHNGGKLKPVPELLRSYTKPQELKAFITRLKRIGERVAEQLEKRYPGIKEIGIDIAVDRELKPWILEVNTRPDPYIFRHLKNKRTFRRVVRYARAYGRLK